MTGNSTGIAPTACKRSLNAPACSRARVTRIRLPSRGNDFTYCSDTLMFLLSNGSNNFISAPGQRLLCQSYTQLLSMFDACIRCPGHVLLDTYLALSIQTYHQAKQRKYPISDLAKRCNGQIATGT